MFKIQWKLAAIVVVMGATLTGGSSVAHAFNPQPDPPGRGLLISLPAGTLTIDGKNIEISSFSFGLENTTTIGSATTGAGAGKVTFHPFTITKPVDATSPDLFRAVESGQHYEKATLRLRKAGGQSFLPFIFAGVFVRTIDWSSASGDESTKESITFEYGGLQLQSIAQDGSIQSTDPLTAPIP